MQSDKGTSCFHEKILILNIDMLHIITEAVTFYIDVAFYINETYINVTFYI